MRAKEGQRGPKRAVPPKSILHLTSRLDVPRLPKGFRDSPSDPMSRLTKPLEPTKPYAHPLGRLRLQRVSGCLRA
ncbi:hypothetical protein EYF80_050669 [Liparis tanakae]|uniref:Uncharacterized protein n=1 Tax=Liparis tanakae TaxID=230148 RepID=A0A4Z2FEF7_9TELE|nr:hypothetical protein EYF80_050669 [Liparis tanakae]